MELMAAWLFMSIIVERLTQVTLEALPFLKGIDIIDVDIEKLIALGYAIVITVGAGLDLFVIFNVAFQWPYVGSIFAAVLIMGGSNYVHDIIGAVNVYREG